MAIQWSSLLSLSLSLALDHFSSLRSTPRTPGEGGELLLALTTPITHLVLVNARNELA